MAKKQDIGLVVAESMKKIMESDEHQWLFGKEAAKKKCCTCDKKCSRKCPCKTDGGCKKSCACCEALAKKAEETSKCCACESKCFEKCPCKHKNSNDNSGDCATDCSMCGDGMMLSTSALEMIEDLLALSEKQEKLGLDDSSEISLKLASFVLAEFKKKAQLPLDENDVTSLDLFEEDPSASINDIVEGGSDTPNLDDALQDILNKHPDFIHQFRRRLRESEPVGSESGEFDLDSILQEEKEEDSLRLTELDPASYEPDFESPIPGHGPTPPNADELAELAQAELAGGRNIYKMHKEPFSMSEEELDDAINEARQELAKSYPESSKDKDLERSKTTEVTATDIMNMSIKFANEDFEDEDESGDVALTELFPSDSASVDDLINDVLHSSDGDFEDDLDEDEELADLAEQMTEVMSHWTGGQGDPLYGVTSLFKARRVPDLENVATARDIVESLFDKMLNSENLDMDSASELNEIHTFLVDYLTAKGYPDPGNYLDSDIGADDSESDALMDTYMDMLGKSKNEDSDEYFGESDDDSESPTTLRSMSKRNKRLAISK